jgi:uncharacterized membrane protein YfcA
MMIVLTAAVFLVSILFSLVGMGGGVLYTPIQVWLGIPFHTAATTSLFLIMVLSFSAAFIFGRARKIDWPLAGVLVSAMVLGGFSGGTVSTRFSEQSLLILFSLFLLGAGYLLIVSREKKEETAFGANGRFYWSRSLADRAYTINLAMALPISLLAGLISGLLGVGGSLIQIPMMVLLFGVPMDIAIGTSTVMIGITAWGGFSGHFLEGHWDPETSLILSVAVFFGAQIGSRISIGLEEYRLRKVLGWVLFGVSGVNLLRVLGQG